MEEFLGFAKWFIIGYTAGILTQLLGPFLRKIIEEAKTAKREW